MTLSQDAADQLMRRPGLREALAVWETERRPGQLVRVAEQHGAVISTEEGEGLEFQSVIRQSSGYSARAVRIRP
jgi:hypothetical protein